ncbi:bifunctional serine/threonine-protein kinase/formylglycine-generating enzyme family protein [Microbulbifer bruguierae]|uniref:Bifunctional serine/threonine-protein kinase/formylglycine-generating enzyme family protein n=1 Tax=Microbulbifer bruguierae TaxID=3029061 RepID=A0ABY8NFY1_9GAMM|nr:bifunctional serine/threonine-protein kinase/formylglycine-generating enzyme family protein [Microbulbifer bruguierae]WGL17274.1 bifunctional serine/threonine-protein kinase/formylglycine-generating enzyme family protein [Microbulbifer bruguierae]
MEVVSSGAASLEIPGYQILKKINQGGMSTVYLATQRSMGRQVALKVMSPVLNADPIFSERFQREANIVGQLSHPNIVAIHDIGRYRSLNYIAMDYLPGGSVADALTKGAIEPLEALHITRQIAMALDHASNKGYVHRDLKPENILFREDGSAVLTDFGVARAVARTTRMTNTGMVVGTPHYMSPEQARGAAVDGRADLYSLGVVFYEMLTSAVPFQAEEAVAIAIKHLTDPIPRLPARHSLYQGLIDRFLAKDPDHRFQRGLDVVDAIDQLLAALDGKTPATATKLNNTSVRVSSLLRALVMTLYGTLSDRVTATWARWRHKPLHQDNPRAEQQTIMRLQQVMKQTVPAQRRPKLLAGMLLVSLTLAWVLFSLFSNKFQWQSESTLVNDAVGITSQILLPDPTDTAHQEGDSQVTIPGPLQLEKLQDLAADEPPRTSQDNFGQQSLANQLRPILRTNLTEPTTGEPSADVATLESPTKAESEARPDPTGTTVSIVDETPPTYSLMVSAKPEDARIRIMNIVPRYSPGIALEPGRYDIEVSKPGYSTVRRWIEIGSADVNLAVQLERKFFPGKTFRSPLAGGGRGPEMVVVVAGEFTMGDNRHPFTSPEHKISINRPFAIGANEITFDDYDRFAKATGRALPSDEKWGRGKRPAVNVSWQDVNLYARWLSEQTGQEYRLASEAEWEYAARAGTETPFWWGEGSARGKANCRRGCASEFNTLFTISSAPVGNYKANEFGLYDTAGNVAEWVQDCFLGDYTNHRNDARPVQLKNCELRAVRGGSMREPLRNISSDYRTGLNEKARSREVGFRLVMEL